MLAPVTVFVGPNNSGKSRALVEIERWATTAQPPEGQVVQNVQFQAWEQAAFEAELRKISVEPQQGEAISPDHVLVGKLRPQDNSAARFQMNRAALIADATSPNGPHRRHHYANYLSLYTLRLDGRSRLSLTDDKPAGDLLRSAPNHLAKLFVSNDARTEVRRIVHEAFGKYLVVDPTNIGQLRFRLSARAPEDDREEQGWDDRARNFHGAATHLSEASDGVKAFVGMLTTLIAGEPNVTLIDEPEAFLHPTLSSRLGKEITAALTGTNKRLFAATHSSSFLMGCVQGGVPINIVRVTYDSGTSTARLLSQDRLVPLMRNPLLRSIGVLDALFYNAVVVTESDADRAFYSEI
ncbi:MAG: ATP-binding protein, partial [Rhodocyclaceae bacterium]|nr:ATP-binding protein [Rhodocyclaceae bacterium]